MEDSAVLETRTEAMGADALADAVQRSAEEKKERRRVVRTLTEFVLDRRMRAALDLMETRLEAGEPIEGILGGYLAPAARHLGSLWEADRVTFTDVTVGVGRLQDLQRDLGEHLLPLDFGGEAPRALLSTVPGEQHAFGVSMVASLLHRHGWDVSGTASARREDLLTAAGAGWYEMIGLSVGCDRSLAELGTLVELLRAVSMNRNVRVVLGGSLAIANAEALREQLAGQEQVEVAADLEALTALADAARDPADA